MSVPAQANGQKEQPKSSSPLGGIVVRSSLKTKSLNINGLELNPEDWMSSGLLKELNKEGEFSVTEDGYFHLKDVNLSGDALESLIKRKQKDDKKAGIRKALDDAFKRDDVATVKYFLEQYKQNGKRDIRKPLPSGSTFLHHACKVQAIQSAIFLIQQGLDINVETTQKSTKALDLLTDKKIAAEIELYSLSLAFSKAALCADQESMQKILAQDGKVINRVFQYAGYPTTPLHLVCSQCIPPVIGTQASTDETKMLTEAQQLTRKSVTFLIERGADVSIKAGKENKEALECFGNGKFARKMKMRALTPEIQAKRVPVTFVALSHFNATDSLLNRNFLLLTNLTGYNKDVDSSPSLTTEFFAQYFEKLKFKHVKPKDCSFTTKIGRFSYNGILFEINIEKEKLLIHMVNCGTFNPGTLRVGVRLYDTENILILYEINKPKNSDFVIWNLPNERDAFQFGYILLNDPDINKNPEFPKFAVQNEYHYRCTSKDVWINVDQSMIFSQSTGSDELQVLSLYLKKLDNMYGLAELEGSYSFEGTKYTGLCYSVKVGEGDLVFDMTSPGIDAAGQLRLGLRPPKSNLIIPFAIIDKAQGHDFFLTDKKSDNEMTFCVFKTPVGYGKNGHKPLPLPPQVQRGLHFSYRCQGSKWTENPKIFKPSPLRQKV